ncbi:MAG TPA: penicillin-binding protein 1A [Alphaproteobacteria bacterium]|jgi:penicillin-binding protein 1A
MRILRSFAALLAGVALLGLVGGGAILAVFYHYGRGLPDYQQLATYEPPVVTRVHAGDGSLIAEYASEKRIFVPIQSIPKTVIEAFLSAEDKNFYNHPGIDVGGIIRASLQNLAQMGQNRRPVGASTITQQVAKNFLLTNEVSLERKIKEALISLRIERVLSKDRILELYLNEIYLGYGSYGVAAAALNYFNKSLDELTAGEAAYLAALPKAPNNYNPYRRPEAAKARRDWVLDRMAEENYITAEQDAAFQATPLGVRAPTEPHITEAGFFAEEVRRQLYDRYGEKGLYRGGLSVRATLDTHLQAIADKALRDGLIRYDRRHGYRGPIAHVALAAGDDWSAKLRDVALPPALAPWRLAVVLSVGGDHAQVGVAGAGEGRIPFDQMKWARPWQKEQHVGAAPKAPSDVLAVGDVVAVDEADGKDVYSLQQIPDVNGAVLALDPHTGRVLAMSGGFSYAASQFNRATQAMRQTGSSFKPFVYTAALDSGFTPSSLVLDAPFVMDQGPGLGLWKPGNYGNDFLGPSTLRTGIEKSRNLMTVRLAQTIGMDKVAAYAKKFGVIDKLDPVLSMSLGAGETTLLRMATGYAMFVNGGKRITPSVIDRIQDRHGKTIYRHDTRTCPGCDGADADVNNPPQLPDDREQVEDPRTAYQMVSILQGVVQRGTGIRIASLGRTLAGKTGTTNDYTDAWFMGFSPDLVVGTYVGFDNPKTLGKDETGSSVTVPIFRDFMEAALKGKPDIPFRIPPGIRLVRVNPKTGQLASASERGTILEAFKPGTEPTGRDGVLDGSRDPIAASGGPVLRTLGGDANGTTGGLY